MLKARVHKGAVMVGCVSEAELEGLRAGTLSGPVLARVQRHLQECPTCYAKARSCDQNVNTQATPPQTSTMFYKDGAGPGAVPAISIEGYEIISEIHRGGQGIVYKALQKSTNRTVAIKVLTYEHAATDRQKQRFQREVSLASNLHHSNIVTVYDSGLSQDRYYYVMEYVHGKPLDEYLKSASLSVQAKLRLFATICGAVHYAHQQGVTHRDLKPGNIIVDARGEPHVLDFGLAKSAGAALVGQRPVSHTSEFMGTLAYASPEQTKGDQAVVDMRSDVYSMGVILFEMLTGKHPYPITGDMVKTFRTICDQEPARPSSINRELDQDIDTVVLRALAKDPRRRYQSVDDFRRDVEHVLLGETIEARRDSFSYILRTRSRSLLRRQRVVAALGLVALLAFGLPLFYGPLFRAWQGPLRWWEKLMTGMIPASQSVPPFEKVRIITIDDEAVSRIEAIAEQESLNDPNNPSPLDVRVKTWKSLRRMHGRLMEKLAAAGVAAVVWDMHFHHDPLEPDPRAPQAEKDEYAQIMAYNQGMLQGIKALRDAKIEPVISVVELPLDEHDELGMSPLFRENHVRWGGVDLGQDDDMKPRSYLAIQRDTLIPRMSIDVMALAAMRHPLKMPVPYLDHASEELLLQFPATGESNSAGVPIGSSEIIKLSAVRPWGDFNKKDRIVPEDIRATDTVGAYLFDPPSDQEYASATIRYDKAVAASSAQLRQWVEGKLVLIGLMMESTKDLPADEKDWHRINDGRELAGLQLHAAAIDMLLRQARSIRYPGEWEYCGLLGCGAVLGLVCAARSRWKNRILALLSATVLLILFSVLAYWQWRYLCNPVFPGLAMLIAFGAVIWFNYVEPLRSDSQYLRRSST